MDSKFIKVLIEEGPLLVEHPQSLELVTACIKEAFIKTGLHRRMTSDQFSQEVNINAALLLKDISEDKKFRQLRAKELNYCFSNGLKGRLGSDKDIDLTYKSLVRWIEGYINHEERKKALSEYVESKRPKPKQLPPAPYDGVSDIKESFADYCEFQEKKKERKKKIDEYRKHGWKPPKDDGIKTIGEIEGVPFSCQDWGKIKIGFLSQRGIAKDGESLIDVFDRLYKVKGEHSFDDLR